MDILTQRKQVGGLSGQLLLNGRPAGPGAVVRCAAYVPQVSQQLHAAHPAHYCDVLLVKSAGAPCRPLPALPTRAVEKMLEEAGQ